MTDKQMLMNQVIRLAVLGYDVEQKRDVIRQMTETICEPTTEIFRAIDDLHTAKMAYDELEQEHIILRNRLTPHPE